MPFNGPGREPRNVDLPDEAVYCVQCGTIYIFASSRDCPSCTLAERLDELEDQLDDQDETDTSIAEHIVNSHSSIDDRLSDIEDRLDRAERDIDLIDGGL